MSWQQVDWFPVLLFGPLVVFAWALVPIGIWHVVRTIKRSGP